MASGPHVSHRELVKTEFSRQAEAMANAPTFSAATIIDRFNEAECRRGESSNPMVCS
jgi:hypothetical protein